MKRLSLLVLAGIVALAAAQNRLTFRDRKTNPRIEIEGDQGFFIPDKSFELTGNVIMKQNENHFTMSCDKATGDLGRSAGNVEFNNVHLTGGVTATQVGESKSFSTKGSSAEYHIEGDQRHLKIEGGVTLDFSGSAEVKSTNAKKAPILRNSVMNIKASSANVTFKSVKVDGKDSAEVQTATIEGPIIFNGTQTDKKDGKATNQTFYAKADHMTYTKGDSGHPEVKLTGNLELKQNSDSGDGPEITGAKSLTLDLDAKYNIVGVRFSSEGQGQIKTVYKPTGKGGH